MFPGRSTDRFSSCAVACLMLDGVGFLLPGLQIFPAMSNEYGNVAAAAE